MPITLTINADNPNDLRQQLADLLGHDAVAAPSADPKPATTRKKAEPAKQDTPASSDAGTATESGTTTGSTGPTAQSNASPSEAVTRDAVRALGGEYGGKAGATALQELFKELGSANGKLSEVTDDKLPALHARLFDLLAAAQ